MGSLVRICLLAAAGRLKGKLGGRARPPSVDIALVIGPFRVTLQPVPHGHLGAQCTSSSVLSSGPTGEIPFLVEPEEAQFSSDASAPDPAPQPGDPEARCGPCSEVCVV